jgi:hypothetical protein
MKKRYYNANTLRETVKVYECEYGMSSVTFYEAHQADTDAVSSIPRHQRSLWASLWREYEELERATDSAHAGQLHPALLVG